MALRQALDRLQVWIWPTARYHRMNATIAKNSNMDWPFRFVELPRLGLILR